MQQGITQGYNTFTAQPLWTLTLLKSGDTVHPETVIWGTSRLASTLRLSYNTRDAAQGAMRVCREQRLFAACAWLPWQHNTTCPHTALLGDAPPNIYSEPLELLRDWVVYGNHNLFFLCYGYKDVEVISQSTKKSGLFPFPIDLLSNPPCHCIFLSLFLPLRCHYLLPSLPPLLCPFLASKHHYCIKLWLNSSCSQSITTTTLHISMPQQSLPMQARQMAKSSPSPDGLLCALWGPVGDCCCSKHSHKFYWEIANGKPHLKFTKIWIYNLILALDFFFQLFLLPHSHIYGDFISLPIYPFGDRRECSEAPTRNREAAK